MTGEIMQLLADPSIVAGSFPLPGVAGHLVAV